MSDLLGGLMKGLSSFIPADTPEMKAFSAQSELNDLKKNEQELLAKIGAAAIDRYGPEGFGDTAEELRLVRGNLSLAERKVGEVTAAQKAAEQADKADRDSRTCPNCGTLNEANVKFCTECGSKVGAAAKKFCTNCGAENAPGTRFCGECGKPLGE